MNFIVKFSLYVIRKYKKKYTVTVERVCVSKMVESAERDPHVSRNYFIILLFFFFFKIS